MKDINKKLTIIRSKSCGHIFDFIDNPNLKLCHNSKEKQSKLSTSNNYQYISQVLHKPINIFSLSNEDNNDKLNIQSNINNINLEKNYTPITTKLIREKTFYLNKRNYPLKNKVLNINNNYTRIIHPTSNAIIQYFNIGNTFNNEYEFKLENKSNKNLNKLDDSLQNNMNNYIISNFFGNNESGIKDLNITILKEKNYNIDHNENRDELLINNRIDNNKANNMINENNVLSNKNKNIKIKNTKGYIKSNDINQNIKRLQESEELYFKDSVNIENNKSEEKNYKTNDNKDEFKKENSNNFIHIENSNKYIDLYNNDKKNIKEIFKNKGKIKVDINDNNFKENQVIINNKINNFNNNYLRNNTINNNIFINKGKVEYINNMEIICNNLNLFNCSKIGRKKHNKSLLYPLYIEINNNDTLNNKKNKKWNNFSINNNKMAGSDMNTNTYFDKNNNFLYNKNLTEIFEQHKNEEVKIKYNNFYYINKPLNFFAENLYKYSRNQAACRHIQNLIDENPQESLNYLFKPILENINQIITHQIGNYLVQKIIIYINQEQLYEILNEITKNFSEICRNIHGTRVIQTIIDNLTTPKVFNYFYQIFKPQIINLLKEYTGSFVVSKFISNFPNYKNEISNIIADGSHILSTYRNGCKIIQKYLNSNDVYLVPKITNKLLDQSLLLIIDKFGNYVLQTLIKTSNKDCSNKLSEKIIENISYYGNHKYSLNVVLKCFEYCDGDYLSNLIRTVQRKENLISLILNEYGNYVVQKVLILSNQKEKKKMLKIIKENFYRLKACKHGQSLINRLIFEYPSINDKYFYIA